MPLALDEYCLRLAESGLVSADEVVSFLAALPAERRPKDGQDLARELIRQKRLTEYQAKKVYEGRASSLVIGEYIVLDKIGAGGMGRVYKAEHRRMARRVALKVLSADAMNSAEAVQRFEQEVRTSARLEHPNIIAAHDAGEHQGTRFLVMQYVEGKDLKALVVERGPLPLETAVNYVYQAACGLAHAHAEGIIHRDIKPGNLLVDKRGVVKVLDMGLARIEEDLKAHGSAVRGRLTVRNQTLGTADYMAPEQADDTRGADARSDIYSLGCTLHYLLIGRAPYNSETVAETILLHHTAPLPSLRVQRKDIPDALEAIFRKMAAKDPRQRYQSMTDLMAAIDSCGISVDLPQAVRVGGMSPRVLVTPSGDGGERPATPGGEAPTDATPTPASGGSGSDAGSTSGTALIPPRDVSAATEETVIFEAQQHDTDASRRASPLAGVRKARLAFVIAGVLAVLLLGALAFGLFQWLR